MSILVHIESEKNFLVKKFEGRGQTRVDFPNQSVILKDFPVPSVIFDPPLVRNFIFDGDAKNASEEGISGLYDGDFSLRSEGLKVFGKVRNKKLMEPDNCLVKDIAGSRY
jgi:hypothetical protein